MPNSSGLRALPKCPHRLFFTTLFTSFLGLRFFSGSTNSSYNAQKLEVTVWRDGKEYRQNYARGKPMTTLTCSLLSDESSAHQGTRIRFWPDKEGFSPFFLFTF